nr:CPBP family intramembrane metalloprotease [Niveispirillum sp. BGYR6]
MLVAFAGQTAAEEAFCRGYLAQAFQILCRNAALAAIPIAVIFATLHVNYPLEKRVTLLGFSLFASYLTWRFGRLEAAMGFHFAHNMLISVFANKGPGFPSLGGQAAKAASPIMDKAALLGLAATLAITMLLYWLLGIKTGFIEHGWRRRSKISTELTPKT